MKKRKPIASSGAKKFNPDPKQTRRSFAILRLTIPILITWVIVLSILYSTLALVRHAHFQSGGFDLGLYDQAVWQYSRFIVPYNTIKDRFILGDHFTLTLPLLAPLFWLWNDVRALLVFQSVWITLSTIPIYLIAVKRGLSALQALFISMIYSLFYGIQYAVFFDFHPVVFGVGLLVWTLYFLETKHWKLFIAALVLTLATQENMGLAVAAVSFLYLFKKETRILSIGGIVGGVGIGLLMAKGISFFSPVGFQYAPQIAHNPIIILHNFFDAPEKKQVWLYTLSAFSFLPIFSLGGMLAIAFDLAQYFVTGPEFARMWSPFMHHRIVLAPLVTLATLDVLLFLKHKRAPITIIIVGLFLSALAQQYVFHYPLNKLTKKDYWQYESWMVDNETILAEVPAGAAIATQQSLIPHLSHRKEIYLAWPREHDRKAKPCGQIRCWWLDWGGRPQYLVIDTHDAEWITQLLETPEHVREALHNMETEGVIRLEKHMGETRLYQIHY